MFLNLLLCFQTVLIGSPRSPAPSSSQQTWINRKPDKVAKISILLEQEDKTGAVRTQPRPQKSLKCSNLKKKQSAEAGRDASQSGTASPVQRGVAFVVSQ